MPPSARASKRSYGFAAIALVALAVGWAVVVTRSGLPEGLLVPSAIVLAPAVPWMVVPAVVVDSLGASSEILWPFVAVAVAGTVLLWAAAMRQIMERRARPRRGVTPLGALLIHVALGGAIAFGAPSLFGAAERARGAVCDNNALALYDELARELTALKTEGVADCGARDVQAVVACAIARRADERNPRDREQEQAAFVTGVAARSCQVRLEPVDEHEVLVSYQRREDAPVRTHRVSAE